MQNKCTKKGDDNISASGIIYVVKERQTNQLFLFYWSKTEAQRYDLLDISLFLSYTQRDTHRSSKGEWEVS